MSSTSGQYFPVILQMGSRFIKVGFGGDPQPIIHQRTNTYDLSDSHVNPMGQSHAAKSTSSSILPFDTDEQGNLLWSYDLIDYDSSKMESLLERIIFDLHYRHLLIEPKKCKVLIVEPLFFPMQLKDTLIKVLLSHMHAKSVLFYPEPIMSCISSGSQYGIVIDLSWNQTIITPVYDLRVIYKLAKLTNRAGRLVHQILRKRFLELKLDIPQENKQMFNFIERFIIRCCYCRQSEEEEEEKKEKKEEQQQFGEGDFEFEGHLIPNSLRYEVVEGVLFKDNYIRSNDIDTALIHSSTLQLIQQLTIDLRKPLSQRIMFTGGLAQIPGVKQRLLKEIKSTSSSAGLSSSDSIKGIKTLGPWQGASLYCATVLMPTSNHNNSSTSELRLSSAAAGMATNVKTPNELSRNKFLNNQASAIDWTDSLYRLSI